MEPLNYRIHLFTKKGWLSIKLKNYYSLALIILGLGIINYRDTSTNPEISLA